ncbi:MAG: PqqD family protein [Solirubrobacterales bacterium]
MDVERLDTTARVPDHVVYRSFEAETLVLNLETGQYHGLNRTAGRMLDLLQEAHGNVRDAVRRLATEYDVDFDKVAPDFASLCTDLEQRGLLEITASGGDDPPKPD